MFQIEVVRADVLTYRADVLALKFAQHLYGVDAMVVDRLRQNRTRLDGTLPGTGDALLMGSRHAVEAGALLFIGVAPLGKFDYGSIRDFSRRVLLELSTRGSDVEHVAMTLHGTGFGLDEAEAFRAELAGLLDAFVEGKVPARLRRVSIVEWDPDTAARIEAILPTLIPQSSQSMSRTSQSQMRGIRDLQAELESVGARSLAKPLIFVAMPFAEEYDDRFHYGIKGAVNAAGYLCERADLASFTGDVIAWVKERIDNATLVIADLTTANPNVYLEVGYAWGCGVKTVLLVADGDELKFDVRAQRCLTFRSIRHLEELLTAELRGLRGRS